MGTPSWDVGETAERCENKAGWAGRGWQVLRTGREAGGRERSSELGQCTCCGGTPSTVLLTFGAGEQDRGGAFAWEVGAGSDRGRWRN